MIPPRVSGLIPNPGLSTGGVPGQPVSGAYGNPGVATNDPPAWPVQGWNYAQDEQGYSVGPNQGPYPGSMGEAGGTGTGAGPDRKVKQPGNNYGGDPNGHNWAPGVMNPPRTPWRGGADFANENTLYDRHVLVRNMTPRTGTETSPAGTPPNPDDPSTPVRPLFAFLNRAVNPQVGSNAGWNQNADDRTRGYSMAEMQDQGSGCFNRRAAQQVGPQFIGEQGAGYGPVYGGVPGLYQPYGSYAGYTARETKGVQSPVEQGQPGDGPHKWFSGPPHGLHSNTYPSYDSTLGRYMAIPQMHSPRIDRPANSKIAGQDYSQTVQPQGETGTVSQSANQRFQTRGRFKQS